MINNNSQHENCYSPLIVHNFFRPWWDCWMGTYQ